MSIIPQMTPYGVYNLTYARKNGHSASVKKPVPSSVVAKGYDTGVFSLYLKAKIFSDNIKMQKNEYKQQIFDVMAAARSLSDTAEKFIDEDWPKPHLKNPEDGVIVELSDNASKKSYDIDIKSLASNHTFTSNDINASEKGILPEGTYSFVLENQKNSEKALFMLGKNSNAHVITEKIADAINFSSKNIAYAVTKHTEDKVSFSVRSTVSGEAGKFKMYDDVGSALSTLGVSLASEGSDGIVFIDGKEQIMKSNVLFIDNGKVKLNFSETGNKNITVENDNEQSVIALRTLVNNYNNFKDTFDKSNSTTTRVADMFNAFEELFEEHFAGQSTGLSIDGEKKLHLDEDLFRENLRSNPMLVEQLKDGNTSIATILNNMASSLSRNPLNTYFSTFPTVHDLPDKYNGILVDIIA